MKLSERMSHEDHCDYYRYRHSVYKYECSCQVAEVRKLENENAWMRREVEQVGHAIFTGEDGYVGTEEDLHAIGQFVEGICETLERMVELEAVVALAQHEDYGIDHAYFCNSTHDTGLPCDCELGPALAELEKTNG